jgi:hypothetical protein
LIPPPILPRPHHNVKSIVVAKLYPPKFTLLFFWFGCLYLCCVAKHRSALSRKVFPAALFYDKSIATRTLRQRESSSSPRLTSNPNVGDHHYAPHPTGAAALDYVLHANYIESLLRTHLGGCATDRILTPS